LLEHLNNGTLPLPDREEILVWAESLEQLGCVRWEEMDPEGGWGPGALLKITDLGRTKLLERDYRREADLPPDGARFPDEKDVPADFREEGEPGGAVLTAPYLKDSPNWYLSGSDLTENYGKGKTLTRRIKVGRAYAYQRMELLDLRDRKNANLDR
jgi:hypothetical protein